MASNTQVEVFTLVAVKPRTNYKTLTPITLKPEQVNIKHNHIVNVNLMQACVYHLLKY